MHTSIHVNKLQHTVCMCVSLVYMMHSLEFGPDILVSSSWICLTSREMCCSRSLFCSSSWWTRAWASSRAVASALSWSFNRWTCTGGGESRDRWTDRGVGGTGRVRYRCSAQCIQKCFPGHRSENQHRYPLSEFPKHTDTPRTTPLEGHGQTLLTLQTLLACQGNQKWVPFASNIWVKITPKKTDDNRQLSALVELHLVFFLHDKHLKKCVSTSRY